MVHTVRVQNVRAGRPADRRAAPNHPRHPLRKGCDARLSTAGRVTVFRTPWPGPTVVP
ncbi:hypothetical protein Ae406Ps2_1725c [Pseudonocardia sp. Ae406_Ps2]|nr:hypothetical protein Ae406Ps2_1725c [Pseudonocardia sp. Ae406_Ps2]